MSEQELCKLITENMFKKSCNKWYTMIIESDNKKAIFEVMTPTKGNIKVRKPIKKNNYNDTYDYIVYRITKTYTLFEIGIFTDTRSIDTEIIKCSYEGQKSSLNKLYWS